MSEQFDLFNLMPEPAPGLIPQDASVPIRPGTYPDLNGLAADCQVCQRCELAKTRTKVVVERGNRAAKILIIGEGPGEQEDLSGFPFVGKAGQLLDKILASVQFTEADVYICNIVKCRPPENRVPQPAEVSACIGYLKEQIRLIDPWIILLTGATAVLGVTGDKRGITKIRGQWLKWEDRYVMPILHPAYLLRNASRAVGSPKWLMWQDIQLVRQAYDRLLAGENVSDLIS